MTPESLGKITRKVTPVSGGGLSKNCTSPPWAGNDVFHQMSPKPMPSFLVVKKGVKIFCFVLRRDAGPMVGDIDDNPSVFADRTYEYRFSRRRSLNCVGQQVNEHLLHPSWGLGEREEYQKKACLQWSPVFLWPFPSQWLCSPGLSGSHLPGRGASLWAGIVKHLLDHVFLTVAPPDK